MLHRTISITDYFPITACLLCCVELNTHKHIYCGSANTEVTSMHLCFSNQPYFLKKQYNSILVNICFCNVNDNQAPSKTGQFVNFILVKPENLLCTDGSQ